MGVHDGALTFLKRFGGLTLSSSMATYAGYGDHLEDVFLDGKLLREQSLQEIRDLSDICGH